MPTPTIALVGNPNTGKTTLFNALAGMNQRVGNYPGVTVETKKGRILHHQHTIDVIDLPGTYSLAPRSPDEMLAVDLLLGQTPGEKRPDLVVTILDASNLERNLYLMTQVMELGVPIVVALNMMDVARGQGLTIDIAALSKNLGLPIIPLEANRGKGLEQLKDAIVAALDKPTVPKGPPFPEAFECEVARLAGPLGKDVSPFLLRRLILDVNGHTERLLARSHGPQLIAQVHQARHCLGQTSCAVPGIEARCRYSWIRQATAGCITRPAQRPVPWTDRLDRVLTHRIWGSLIFLTVMFLVFESIYVVAHPLMDLIKAGQDKIGNFVGGMMDSGPLRSLLVDGVILGVGSVIAFLPQILILFAFIAVLEDCGYMSRAAFLMDRIMSRCGLNGKSFIPLLSSVACAVPGIMASRVIENRRDRLATIVVAPLMSCSARLPVYLLLIGAFLSPEHGFPVWVPGLALFGMYCIGLVVAPLMALLLKRTLLRGDTPVFVMEMPLYKRPSLALVARRAWDSGWMFLRRAGTMILASMVLIWALLYFPNHDAEGHSYEDTVAKLEENKEVNRDEIHRVQSQWVRNSILGQTGRTLEPIVRPLGWDWRIGMAALASFPAREVMVGTLGIIFNQGKNEDDDDEKYAQGLGTTLQNVTFDDEPTRKVFTVPVALSIMVFFALCCQCISTLVVIRRETRSWAWPAFTFVYMTLMAYVGALITYQVGSLF